MKIFLSYILLVFSFLPFSLAQTPSVILEGVHLIHPETGKTQHNMSILIEGDQIAAIAPAKRLPHPADASIVPLHGKYLMPGLVDAHVHYFQSGGLYTRPDAIDLRSIRPYAEERQWLRDHAPDLFARYIQAGITTTFDVGGPMSNYAIRDQAAHTQLAPTLWVTGPLISTYVPEEFRVTDPPIVKINSPEAARELVRKQLPYKPDFIKIWYIVLRGQTAEENLPIIKATIEESHKHGLPVAVHATQLETARLAVEAGADFLVHSVEDERVDDAFATLLVERNVSYIPTLIVGGNYEKVLSQHLDLSRADLDLAEPHITGSLQDLQHLPDSVIPGWTKRLMSGSAPNTADEDSIMAYNLRKLYRAGVNVATGTDAGNIGSLHASSYYAEIAAMHHAGLTNAEILKASTFNAANILDKTDEFGKLTVGNQADLLILNANPLEDLDHLQDIHAVVKSGRLYEADQLAQDSPQQIAQRQLNAYNAGNVDAFVGYYHPEVEVYQFPNTLRYTGREKMRGNYAGFFEKNPKLHCELTERIVLGNKVIDREHITGLSSGGSFDAVAIYEIEGGLIRRVYFISE